MSTSSLEFTVTYNELKNAKRQIQRAIKKQSKPTTYQLLALAALDEALSDYRAEVHTLLFDRDGEPRSLAYWDYFFKYRKIRKKERERLEYAEQTKQTFALSLAPKQVATLLLQELAQPLHPNVTT